MGPPASGSAAPCAERRAATPALRPQGASPPRVIAVGGSTGAVEASRAALVSLLHFTDRPIVLALHLTAAWVERVVRQMERALPARIEMAREGAVLTPRTVHVAPGGQHVRIVDTASGLLFRLDPAGQDPIAPSVDRLFASAAKAVGEAAFGIVLTGMGDDGLEGARAIISRGGTVIAQDEASSAVWGMPGAVVAAGLASAVVPPQAMGALLRRYAPACEGGAD